jgi:anti-sigma-K factor RskA
MNMSDDHLLAGAYALGALDRDESTAFEAHLARCESCRDEVAGLTETAARLAVAVPAAVSEPLLDRVMQQVRATPQLPPVHAPPGRINGNPSPPPVPARFLDTGGSVTPLRRRAARPRRRALAAAAVIALALAGVTTATRLIAERNHRNELAAVIEDPAARHVALRGVPGEPATGSVSLHVQPSGDAVVDASSLAALDPTKTYELWFLDDQGAHSAATFTPDDSGVARVRFRAPVSDPDLFGVTVEPAGGSDAPTSPIIFQGEA